MSQSNIINLGLLLVTAIGVGIAIWQAWDARAARDAARAASTEAQQHEEAALQASQDSASAATRSAAALEESNDIARKSLPQDPWKFIQHSDNKYELRNDSQDTLWAVNLIEADDVDDTMLFRKYRSTSFIPANRSTL